MPADYLHNHPQFADLIRIVAQERAIAPGLIEKDHWIMHCLYGLQQLGFKFELKGGTSLSKGFQIINRFSEDIDITAFRWLVIRNLELGDRNSRWEKSLELLQAEPEPLKSWRLA